MSFEATAWAWRQDLASVSARSRQTDKLVLLALANYADEHGQCWPSQGRLSEMIGCSKDSVQRSIARLCSAGVISKRSRGRKGGGRTSDLIVLHMSVSAEKMSGKGRNLRLNVKPHSCAAFKDRTAVRHEPSLEPSIKNNCPTSLTEQAPREKSAVGQFDKSNLKGEVDPELRAIAGSIGLDVPAVEAEAVKVWPKRPSRGFRARCKVLIGERLPGLDPGVIDAAMRGDPDALRRVTIGWRTAGALR